MELFTQEDGVAGEDQGQPSQPAAKNPAEPAAPRRAAPATKPAQPAEGPRFEDAFGRLETLVAEMERGDLPLEQLLQRFEEGVKLVRYCNQFLKQAQLRVEQYVEQKDGHWVLKDVSKK